MVRTRTTALQMHTRQWIGTYAGRGNGDYRGELASALRAITTYLKHFALPQRSLWFVSTAIWRCAVDRSTASAGVTSRDTGRGYQILEHPQIQRVLAHPPTASMTRMNTGVVVELFEGGWLELGEGLPPCPRDCGSASAPAPGKAIPVGKRVGEWVYELS